MSHASKNLTKRSHSATSSKRGSKIFQLFHATNSLNLDKPLPSSHSLKHNQHHRSQSNTTQFNRLKSVISSLFLKKTTSVKPKKSRSANPKPKKSRSANPKPKLTKKASTKATKARSHRSQSFSFRHKIKKKNRKKHKNNKNCTTNKKKPGKKTSHKKTNSCHINTMYETGEYYANQANTNSISMHSMNSIHPALSTTNILLDDIIEIEEDLSESDEFKYNDPTSHPRLLAPRSSSFMRHFEKRPEYITYYPPASLIDVFSNITVDEKERSVTVETTDGVKTRIDAVDQLFELASMTLDYSNFYGYNEQNNNQNKLEINDEYQLNEASFLQRDVDVSVLSSLPEDDGNNYQCNLSWQ